MLLLLLFSCFTAQSDLVFEYQEGAFMQPVVDIGKLDLWRQQRSWRDYTSHRVENSPAKKKKRGKFKRRSLISILEWFWCCDVIVGEMLNTTDMDVIVYQGQVDLICLTKGANDWVLKLDPYWTGLDEFMVADRCVRATVSSVTFSCHQARHSWFAYYVAT